jgi:hypothetical protein
VRVGEAYGAAERWERLAGGWPEMEKVRVIKRGRRAVEQIKVGKRKRGGKGRTVPTWRDEGGRSWATVVSTVTREEGAQRERATARR